MRWRNPVLILVCASIVLMLSFGIRTSFGIFLAPMTTDLGIGRQSFAFAIAIQNLLWGLSQPFAGAIADRYGSGRMVAGCAVMYVLGLVLMAHASTGTDLTMGAGVLIGLALSGTGFPVILAVVGRSVDESRRSLFLGFASAGGSSGQLLMVPLGQVFLDGFGWSTALLGFALLSSLMVPLAAFLTGKTTAGAEGLRKQSLKQAIAEASRHGGYWYLTAGFFVCGFHVAFIATHLPAFIIDRGGAPFMGAAALALIGFGNIIGSLTCGVLGGRYPKKYVLAGLYLGRSVIITLFLLTPVSNVSILLFAAGIGMLWLGTVPLTSGLVAQMFGMRYMATLFGFVFFSHQLGSFLGVWLGGYVFDTTGSYDLVWWIAVALGLAAAALHWPIDERPVVHPLAAES
ncbi:MAG: MFS transporter [Gammaproteobacteria bacterium]|nr:MAG: MFS transporter [Gammaproteobacteria bacterium]